MPTVSQSLNTIEAARPVRSIIEQAASRTDTDFSYLLAQAKVESDLDAGARATTSSAAGLFQFIGQTWLETVQKHGGKHGMEWAAGAIETVGGRAAIRDPDMRAQVMQLRFDPAAASLMAGEYARENAVFLEARTGRAPDHVELYLAHFLGPAGAAKFIEAHDRDPEKPASALFGEAAGANRAVFFDGGRPRSLDEVRSLFAAKLERSGADASAPSPLFAAQAGTIGHPEYRARGADSIAPPRPSPRRPMSEVLSGAFGAQPGRGLSERAAGQVADAYGKLAGFGL